MLISINGCNRSYSAIKPSYEQFQAVWYINAKVVQMCSKFISCCSVLWLRSLSLNLWKHRACLWKQILLFYTTHLISHPKYTYVLKIIFKTSVLKTKNQKLLGDMMFSIFFCFSSYSTSPLTSHFVLYLAPASTSCLKNLI